MDLGKFGVSACLMLAFALLAPTVASADDGADVYANEVAEQAENIAADELSDEQLERYVLAAKEISSIRLRHADEIASEGVDSAESAESAQEEMTAAIEEHDLSVREYREIEHLAHNDPQINRRVKNIESRVQ